MADGDRILKRRHLVFYLEVYDNSTNELLGQVVDITTKGLKLISKKAIGEDRLFRLKMMLPEGYFKEQLVEIDCKSLWCRPDVNPDFYVTGFEVQNIDLEAKGIIAQLIQQLGFND